MQEQGDNRDPLTAAVIGAAIEVHREMGCGLLESTYEDCLAHEFGLRGIKFRRQVVMPVVYKGMPLREAYRIDFIVEEALIVEIKAVDRHHDIHEAQILTYSTVRLRKRAKLILYFIYREFATP